MNVKLSQRSIELFKAYFDDAGNWSGMPLVGGNVGGSKADRGNLTHLKRAGLIRTQVEEGNTWIIFTEAGKAFGETLEAARPEPESGPKDREILKTTKVASKTAAKPAAKPVTAAKPAAKPVTAAHPFLSSEDAPLQCSECGQAPSGKLHRRYMDTMRQMWRAGSAAEREEYLTHIEDGQPAHAKLTWTALPADIKRSLAACLDLEAE
jgi:hypothetical protein